MAEPSLAPPTVPSTARGGRGHGGRIINLLKLAETQRQLLACILGMLVLQGANVVAAASGWPPVSHLVILGLYLIVAIATIVCVVRMAIAYGVNPVMAALGGVATVIPCAGILLLVLINQRVTGSLQRAGVKVGLMGVKRAEMNKLRLGVCGRCGYDLRGLSAPNCPECGQAIAAAAAGL